MRWNEIKPVWQNVIHQAVLQRTGVVEEPDNLVYALSTPVLRLVGPSGTNPSLDFDIEDLEGIEIFSDVENLIVMNHQIKSIQPVAKLSKLKSLFVQFNYLESLEGIEELKELTGLYCQSNQLTNIRPIAGLTNLKEFNCSHNDGLTSFDGINAHHELNLEHFGGLPNKGIRQKEVLRIEREIGIRVWRS